MNSLNTHHSQEPQTVIEVGADRHTEMTEDRFSDGTVQRIVTNDTPSESLVGFATLRDKPENLPPALTARQLNNIVPFLLAGMGTRTKEVAGVE